MNHPKISIIVPIYNKEDFLHRCIKSILSQSYENWELLLVNDGSTDASSSICKQYSTLDKRIDYYEQENKGVSAARNTAIEHASGDYICYIDPDDYIEDTLLEICLPFMQNGIDCIVYGINKVDNSESKVHCVDKDIIVENVGQMGTTLSHIKHQHLFTPIWNKMYRKKIIDTYIIRYVEGIELFEDLIFNQDFFYHIRNLACITFVGYNYSVYSNKDCLSHKQLSPKEMMNVAKRISKNDFRDSTNSELKYYDYSFYMNFLRKIIKTSIIQDEHHRESIKYIKLLGTVSKDLPTHIRNRYFIEYSCKSIDYLLRINCLYIIFFIYRIKELFTHLRAK